MPGCCLLGFAQPVQPDSDVKREWSHESPHIIFPVSSLVGVPRLTPQLNAFWVTILGLFCEGPAFMGRRALERRVAA